MKGEGEVLPDHEIAELIKGGAIKNSDESLINPGSLDLIIGRDVWNMTGAISPYEGEKIEDAINDLRPDYHHEANKKFRVEPGANSYIVKLVEELELPGCISAKMHNKSGRARIGVGIEGLVDGVDNYNEIPAGYKGPLYLQLDPTVFPVTFTPEKTSIPQIRFYKGMPIPLTGYTLEMVMKEHPILTDANGKAAYTEEQKKKIVETGKFTFTTDLSGNTLYYRPNQKRTIDLDAKDELKPQDFFVEERALNGERIAHVPAGEFILLKSLQHIRVPPGYAAEIDTYYRGVKVHLAGLVNPGHGYAPEGEKLEDSHIVFEITAGNKNMKLRHDQAIAEFSLYKMSSEPEQEYMGIRSTDFSDLRSFLPSQFKK